MLVNSTGLGKTTLEAGVKELKEVEYEDRKYLQLVIESSNPVRWHITVKMSGSDVRQFIWTGMKNVLLLPKIFWYLAFKS